MPSKEREARELRQAEATQRGRVLWARLRAAWGGPEATAFKHWSSLDLKSPVLLKMISPPPPPDTRSNNLCLQ